MDLFARDRSRAFRHVHRSPFMIEGHLRDQVVERRRGWLAIFWPLEKRLRRERLQRSSEGRIRSSGHDGFLMCEHGRADALLEASVPSAALRPYFVATDEQERAWRRPVATCSRPRPADRRTRIRGIGDEALAYVE